MRTSRFSTLPSLATLDLTLQQLSALRQYERYWLLVKKHKFIQIILDIDTKENVAKQRKTVIKAMKKEKLMDEKDRYCGVLTFSWFENILMVRIL